LLDWYVHFDHLRDLQLRAGQYKVPFNRQRVISSGDLQLVDRALANGEFTLDRDVGLDLRSSDFLGLDRLRYYAGVYMGEGRDTFKAKNFDMMYIGRVEFLPFGMFEDYKEADFERSKRPNISLGGAYAFLDGAQRNRGILGDVPTDGGATDYHNVTADFVLKMLGLSVTGEFFYRKGYRDYGEATVPDAMGTEVPAPRELPRTGIGWFLQGGFLIPRIPFEIAGRYSEVRPFDTSSLRERHEAGGGVGYYFAQHSLKLQLDYFRNWFDADLVRGTDEVRLQLQLAY
jgi:hypothetical protein